jgi:hypothetical protein
VTAILARVEPTAPASDANIKLARSGVAPAKARGGAQH